MGQTQIRLLLKKQSDQGLSGSLFLQICSYKSFVNSRLYNQHFIRELKEKSVENFRRFTLLIFCSPELGELNHGPL